MKIAQVPAQGFTQLFSKVGKYMWDFRSIQRKRQPLETGMAAADRREVVIIPISA